MTISDKTSQMGAMARDKASTMKATASDALSSAKGRASDLAMEARQSASQAREKTAAGIDASPMAALIGGLALGALAAAVLPRTRKEDELLGDIGGRINDSARNAAQAATDAGRDKLDELGINKDTAMQKAKEIAQSAAGVVKETANAAASGAKAS